MNYTHWLVILSAIISIAGSYAYLRDTIKGKTQPNRVTWSMWAFAPLLGTIVAISANADMWATVRTFLAGFLPLIIFFGSFFNKKSYWKLTFFDLACGATSLVAIFVWLIISSPKMAILLLVIADGFAALPTLRKAWLKPETETKITYAAGFLGVVLILPSIPVWNIENSAFQIYLLIVNFILLIAVFRKWLFPNLKLKTDVD